MSCSGHVCAPIKRKADKKPFLHPLRKPQYLSSRTATIVLHSRGEAIHLHRSFHKWASKEMVAAGTQVRRRRIEMMMMMLMMMTMIDSG